MGWIIIESISWKKAKSQITVTEDVFSWEQTFCIRTKGRSVVALLRDTSYIRLTTSLSSGLFSTLRLVFGRYKLYSECVTTTIQKQNYRNTSVRMDQTMLFWRPKKLSNIKNLPFLLLMTIASSRLHQARFWVGRKKRFNHNFENIALLAKWIVLTRTAS